MQDMTSSLFKYRQKERIVVICPQFKNLETIKQMLDLHVDLERLQFEEYTNPL